MSTILRAAAVAFFGTCLTAFASAFAPSFDLDVMYSDLMPPAAESVESVSQETNITLTAASNVTTIDEQVAPVAFESVSQSLSLPSWTARVGAVYLHRARPDDQALIVPTAGPGLIASGGDFDLDWEAAPDVSLIHRTEDGNFWEMRYFGFLDWDSSTVGYGAVGNVRIGSFSNFGATNLTGDYGTKMHNFEINVRNPRSDRFTLIGGFRYIELTDTLNYDITFPAFTANYNWHEDNQLYGAQIGGDFDLWRLNEMVTVNAIFKGGVFGNHMNNDFTLRPSTGGVFDNGGENNDVALVGEIGVTGAIQFTDHIALRSGYQMMWLDGLALASDNMARATRISSQAGIDEDGHLFIHGGTVSLDFMW
jgi:hypothetical protein